MRTLAGRLTLAAAFAAGCAAGCAAQQAGGSRDDRDLITQAQLRAGRFTDAYTAVAELHGAWLAARGLDNDNMANRVWVYRDNVRLGGVDLLRDIAAADVDYMRHYNATSANARWGEGHGAGAIYVAMRPR